MAGKRQRQNGTWEYKFQRLGLFEKPVYFTFDTEAEGDSFVERVEPLLARGIIPVEFTGRSIRDLRELIERYGLKTLSNSDLDQMGSVLRRIGNTKFESFTYPWCETWVEKMRDEGLAPSTITKNVGMLARCVDWALRSGLLNLPNNPLRLLPKGYASKNRNDKTWFGERDRRLSEDGAEEAAIRETLSKNSERMMMFDLALETAMRLREIYTLTIEQVNIKQSTIFLEKTKNGDKRQVPMSSVLKSLLAEYLASLPAGESRLFPSLWGGALDQRSLKETTNRLSKQFKGRFVAAGAKDLNFHDLRHEATARIYERTRLTDVEISQITGHKDLRMLKRYANLRASTLAEKMW
jgi:integrase